MDVKLKRSDQIIVSLIRQLYDYFEFYNTYPQIVSTVSAQFKHLFYEEIMVKKNMMNKDDNPPIGILLCTDKGSELVEYALAGMDDNLFASKYQLELPKKEDMQKFITEIMKEERAICIKYPVRVSPILSDKPLITDQTESSVFSGSNGI